MCRLHDFELSDGWLTSVTNSHSGLGDNALTQLRVPFLCPLQDGNGDRHLSTGLKSLTSELGCREIAGRHGDGELTFVVWIAK